MSKTITHDQFELNAIKNFAEVLHAIEPSDNNQTVTLSITRRSDEAFDIALDFIEQGYLIDMIKVYMVEKVPSAKHHGSSMSFWSGRMLYVSITKPKI